FGTANGEEIYGADGNDTIKAKAGNDVLDGGLGDDVLTGGSGSDRFILSHGNDVVKDFEQGTDLLDFHPLMLNYSDLTISYDSQTADSTISFTVDGETHATTVLDVQISANDFMNAAPVGVDDSVSVDEDGMINIDVLANDSDADGDTISIASVSSASNGSVSINSNNTILYTANNDFVGNDSFTYEVGDGAETTLVTVNVTVLADPIQSVAAVESSDFLGATISFNIDALDIAGGDQLFIEGLPDKTALYSRENVHINNDVALSISGNDVVDITDWDLNNLKISSEAMINSDSELTLKLIRGSNTYTENFTLAQIAGITYYSDLGTGTSTAGSDFYWLDSDTSGNNANFNAGDGNDFIYRYSTGGAYENGVSGGADNDVIIIDTQIGGGSAANQIKGGSDVNDYDIIYGSDSIGLSGYETLAGDYGSGELYGRADDDVLNASYGNMYVDGGDGIDNVTYVSSSAVIVDLEAGETHLNDGNNTFKDYVYNIENIRGSNNNDELYGDAGNNNIRGGDGDDIIDGRDGDDTLLGEGGSDTFVMSLGTDTVSDFEDGVDFINYHLAGIHSNEIVLSYDGTDTTISAVNFTGTMIVENIELTADDFINNNPIQSADTYTAYKDMELSVDPEFGVLANDTDADGDTLSVSLDSNVSHGTLSLASDGTFSYTVDSGYSGTSDSFTYSVTDGISNPVTATVTININTSPLLTNVSVSENSNYLAWDVDFDIDNFNSSTDTVMISGLPDKTVLYAADNAHVNNDSVDSVDNNSVDITHWDLSELKLSSAEMASGNSFTFSIIIIRNDQVYTQEVDVSGYSSTVTFIDDIANNTPADTGFYWLDSAGSGNGDFDAGAGNDFIYRYSSTGALEDNMLSAGDGNDIVVIDSPLSVGFENNIISTGDGNDVVYGNDSLSYTQEYIDVGVGSGMLYGRFGSDFFDLSTGTYSVDGGGSYDIIRYVSSSQAVTVDLTTGETFSGSTLKDTFVNVESVEGSAGDDVFIVADSVDLFVNGGDGDDTVIYQEALAGVSVELFDDSSNDTQFYDAVVNVERVVGSQYGDTFISDFSGYDLDGDQGNDTLSYEVATVGVTIDLSSGTVTAGAITETFVNFESIIGSDFDDTILSDLAGYNLTGGDGFDTLSYAGLSSSITVDLVNNNVNSTDTLVTDTLVGDFERIIGTSADDTFISDTVDKIFTGGGGVDTVNYQNLTSSVNVKLYAEQATSVDGTGALIEIENIIGTVFGDTLAGDAQDNIINGGAGIDTVSYAHVNIGSVEVNLRTGTATGADGNDTLSNIENIIGGTQDDILIGNAAVNTINGGQGVDTVSYYYENKFVSVDLDYGTATTYYGGSVRVDTLINIEQVIGTNYDDILNGDIHDNAFEGLNGNDVIDGKGGVDSVSYENASSFVTVNLIAGSASGGNGNDTLYNIENIIGSSFDDTLVGTSSANTIIGGAGNDRLEGKQGADILEGGNGVDTIFGGDGDDFIYGDAGNDILSGQNDNDTLYGGAGNDEMDGNDGNDSLFGEDGKDTMHGGNGIDNLHGGLGNDTIYGESGNDSLYGDEGIDKLYGDSGNDTLEGGDGSDQLYGGIDQDILKGGNDNDFLFGESGLDVLYGEDGTDWLDGGDHSDTLDGGLGNDTLTGGNGSDEFVASLGDDTVTDFQNGSDVIEAGTIGGVHYDLSDVGRDISISQDGADTLIEFKDVIITIATMRLQNQNAGDIDVNDFEFDGVA
ncbi:MAG: Ig-like domain-containing protein, partial [Gammaproteobacteria bacterium]